MSKVEVIVGLPICFDSRLVLTSKIIPLLVSLKKGIETLPFGTNLIMS